MLCFTTLQIYTILKLVNRLTYQRTRFTTLQIYTILKRILKRFIFHFCFTTLQIYTILKHPFTVSMPEIVLLPYRFTLFSNIFIRPFFGARFYYLIDLHYSQTSVQFIQCLASFTTLQIYTILKQRLHLFACQQVLLPYRFTLFSNIFLRHSKHIAVLLPYRFTLFSNRASRHLCGHWFYYLIDLHYSQTLHICFRI